VRPKEFLVLVKNMACGRQGPGRRVDWAPPSTAVRTDQTQVAHVVGGADWREVLKFLVDVTRPEIRRFEDVHIAVENFETAMGHKLPQGYSRRSNRSIRSSRRTTFATARNTF
jgi:hypothetical protein